MPFLPTTLSDFLKIALCLLPIAIGVWAIRRDEKKSAAYTNVAVPADELRDLISMIPEERLRPTVREMVRVSAAERPVTKKIYDKIVLQARNEAISRDQVASLSTANA
jgi:hypothetical protein